MEKLQIPKKVKKVKMLLVPVTEAEHEEIKMYCKEQNVTTTSLVRFALKNTYHLKTI